MLFNSLEFAFFLPIVFLLYWFLTPSGTNGPRYSLFRYWHVSEQTALRIQNAFVLVASYIFYGWWDWRFLLLIAFTSFCSWGSGLLIGKSVSSAQSVDGHKKAKAWMIANIVLNLGILAVFKYYDFFVSEFGQLFGISTDSLLLRIILPVGISFYTFQALSYSIDVYRQKIEPTKDIIVFFAFIAFFPQLVAGPIERATNLLPQFLQKRTFSYDQATDGMRQILWGLFKKIVVADNCATYVDQVWATYDTQTGSTLLLAAILFTFQIYGDFSGYSDIAIGTAKLFGIKLMRNFNNPYFSRDIAEFWRRWHISLTTWFRDYVYIPLGGSRPEVPAHIKNPDRYKKWIIVRNTFVIFLLSGFWHGANWTFIAWGAYHALLFLPLILLGKNRKYTNQVAEGRLLPTWKECGQMLLTFALVVFGWIIFRAETISQAWEYICGMLQFGTLRASYRFFLPDENLIWPTNIFILIMLVIEWFQRNKQHGLEVIDARKYKWLRVAFYYILILFIILNAGTEQTFIYFQF
ncbi:MAG: MBOAT family protein [Paludibacteraceae bacterium]|nr:MBOAT family protein [Paludibacteraceae bacterium]